MGNLTRTDLVKMWSRPVETQYDIAVAKILEAIVNTKGNISISFSGGKDSALLLDMYADIIANLTIYKDKPIKVNFANTTNETPTMLKFVRFFIPYIEDKYGVKIEFNEIRPSITWAQFVKKNGLPLVSKSQGKIINILQKETKELGVNPDILSDYMVGTYDAVQDLRDMGFSKTAVRSLTGYTFKTDTFSKSRLCCLSKKWLPLVSLDVPISGRCCETIKEAPLRKLEKLSGGAYMTGEQASESEQRITMYLKNGGCNTRLPGGKYKSTPFGAMTKDGILYSIKTRKVPICSDYGDVVEIDDKCYKCTKTDRTGCALCGFGIQFDPERFVRLQSIDPAKVKFAFKPISEGGVGYLEAITYMNEKCGTNIIIPKI